MGAEADIERKCAKIATRQGMWMPKWAAPGIRGVPDRILFRVSGRIDFIEFKAPGKKPTRMQEYTAETLRAFGFSAHVIDSVEAFEELIDE